MYLTMSSPEVIRTPYALPSTYLKREVELEIFLPDNLMGNETLNLLLFNDGQDAEEMRFQEILSELYAKGKIAALALVAVKASVDRVEEYGVAGMPDFMGRGSKAKAYTQFITKELTPFIQETIATPVNGKRAFAGYSLGGLSAFDIAWNNDNLFDAVGVFSGSFWWRTKDLKDGYTDADRIAHQLIRKTTVKPDLKFWLMTGTEDETADRNRNLIIDSIDDTIDVIKELVKKGYSRPDEVSYFEKVGGQHNIDTWSRVLPAFLMWAFPPKRNL